MPMLTSKHAFVRSAALPLTHQGAQSRTLRDLPSHRPRLFLVNRARIDRSSLMPVVDRIEHLHSSRSNGARFQDREGRALTTGIGAQSGHRLRLLRTSGNEALAAIAMTAGLWPLFEPNDQKLSVCSRLKGGCQDVIY
ncbi:MAG: hypothetical protein V7676_00385 [Parasphingorhabdus sp.]|uniref:hypothetical protein n=1 Tax=Parasphingorhabdus sp. TaxID=2709688 RepID=UPI003003231A